MKKLLILLIVFSVSCATAAELKPRSETWAQPVSSKAVDNFFQLDEKVYRSAQPDREGFLALRDLGIRNVLNLRDYHSDDKKARGYGFSLYRVKMEAGDIETRDVIRALRIIKESPGPIVIHCWHGSDRTGLISAMYRIVFHGWSKEDAINELMNGGYGYHSLYKNIPEFIRKANIDEIKQKVFAP
ncbi:MAG: hypothetical protein A2X56_06620 [Nitrospirae bacterium GWC2_57_13]|jgi:tyrosine-protein phosphatase SIW14|nr:MAG: hypothetical protein A2X56_06620 [Nitrospirae bacterium GWC2_57_13]OGW44900.1 MAG: hypothetical protein A2X57_00755 [Nitrospirae bacterium GWD2_57_8]HAS54667.1 protein tyrosine phosphatase [Nitrospiraceae bacterium]